MPPLVLFVPFPVRRRRNQQRSNDMDKVCIYQSNITNGRKPAVCTCTCSVGTQPSVPHQASLSAEADVLGVFDVQTSL